MAIGLAIFGAGVVAGRTLASPPPATSRKVLRRKAARKVLRRKAARK